MKSKYCGFQKERIKVDTQTKNPGIFRYRGSESGGYLLTRAACLLSVRLKKNVGTKRRPQDVRFTELLIGGKKKNRSVVKKIQYHHIERKEYAICCISRKIIVP